MHPLFGRLTYLAERAGDDIARGGVSDPASPAGDNDPNPPDSDAGDADADDSSSDEPEDGAGDGDEADRQRQDPNDQRIPRKRAEEMWRNREAKIRKEYEGRLETTQRELTSKVETFIEQFQQRWGHQPDQNQIENAVRTLLGKKPVQGNPDMDRPLTRGEFMQLMQRQNQQLTDTFRANREATVVEQAIRQAQVDHKDFFDDDPMLVDRILSVYRTAEDGVTIADVIKSEVKRLGDYGQKFVDNYAKRKQRDARIAPLGRGTAPRSGTPKKFDLGKPDQQDAAVDDILDRMAAGEVVGE